MALHGPHHVAVKSRTARLPWDSRRASRSASVATWLTLPSGESSDPPRKEIAAGSEVCEDDGSWGELWPNAVASWRILRNILLGGSTYAVAGTR